jgi:hypothetical protein
MSRPVLLLLCAALGLTLGGCKSCDKVESALRSTEESLRESREELARQGVYTSALEHEMRIIRGEVYAGTPGKPVAVFPVRGVAFGSQTGGHDAPNGLGDDGVQIILEPRNAEGKPIQVPGEAVVQIQEITPEGFKRLLSSWVLDRDQIKASWRQGLLSQGYNVILPWKLTPTSEKLRLVAQFKLEDGRVFETDKDITVRLPKGTTPRVDPLPSLPAPRTTIPVTPMPPPNELPPPAQPRFPEPLTVPPVPVVPQKKPDPFDGPSLGWQPILDPPLRRVNVEMGPPRK